MRPSFKLILLFLLLALLAPARAAEVPPGGICLPYSIASVDFAMQGFKEIGRIGVPNGNQIILLERNGNVSGYSFWTIKDCLIFPGIPLGNIRNGLYDFAVPIPLPGAGPEFLDNKPVLPAGPQT